MQSDRVTTNRAWQALKESRRELAPLVQDRVPSSISFWTRNQYHKHQSTKSMKTGASISQAVKHLEAEGMETAECQGVIRQTVIRRFSWFAKTWNRYCNSDGWVRDLLACDQELRSTIIEQHEISSFVDQLEGFRADPGAISPDITMLFGLAQEQSRLLTRMRNDHEHPAIDLLEKRHGLDPRLARAVMLYSQAVPLWAYIAINAFLLIAGWIFWLALVDPQNAVFTNESVGGVGIGHYVFLPLFILGMLLAEIWLIIDSPRREKAWRGWLEKFKQEG